MCIRWGEGQGRCQIVRERNYETLQRRSYDLRRRDWIVFRREYAGLSLRFLVGCVGSAQRANRGLAGGISLFYRMLI